MKSRWISGKLYRWKFEGRGVAGFENKDGYCDRDVELA